MISPTTTRLSGSWTLNKVSILAAALAIMASCRNGSSTIEPQRYDFGDTIAASFNKNRIHEVIKPVDFLPTKNYLAVLHDADMGEEQLYIYSLDSLKFLYSFAKKGTGPAETIALDLFRNAGHNDNIELIDQSCYKRLSYVLTDTGAFMLGSSHLDIPPKGPLQEMWWVNDSVMVCNTLDWELFTYNVNTDSVIDAFYIADLFDGITDKTDVRKLCDFHFSLRNGNLVIAMERVNQLLTGRISDNMIEIDAPDGKLISIPEITDVIYYTFVAQTDNLIFAQYFGRSMPVIPKLGPFRPDFTQEIGCFDSELNPICKILPDIETPCYFIDPHNNRLLCWDFNSDFDYIYTYPLPTKSQNLLIAKLINYSHISD